VIPGLKKVLEIHPNFSFDATNGLLQHLRQERIGTRDLNRVLKFFVVVKHKLKASTSVPAWLPLSHVDGTDQQLPGTELILEM
jgi:hypothetical protein